MSSWCGIAEIGQHQIPHHPGLLCHDWWPPAPAVIVCRSRPGRSRRLTARPDGVVLDRNRQVLRGRRHAGGQPAFRLPPLPSDLEGPGVCCPSLRCPPERRHHRHPESRSRRSRSGRGRGTQSWPRPRRARRVGRQGPSAWRRTPPCRHGSCRTPCSRRSRRSRRWSWPRQREAARRTRRRGDRSVHGACHGRSFDGPSKVAESGDPMIPATCPSFEGMTWSAPTKGDRARPLLWGHHRCGTAPGSHRLRLRRNASVRSARGVPILAQSSIGGRREVWPFPRHPTKTRGKVTNSTGPATAAAHRPASAFAVSPARAVGRVLAHAEVGRPQPVPGGQPGEIGLVRDLLLRGHERARQDDRHLLLPAGVEEP